MDGFLPRFVLKFGWVFDQISPKKNLNSEQASEKKNSIRTHKPSILGVITNILRA